MIIFRDGLVITGLSCRHTLETIRHDGTGQDLFTGRTDIPGHSAFSTVSFRITVSLTARRDLTGRRDIGCCRHSQS